MADLKVKTNFTLAYRFGKMTGYARGMTCMASLFLKCIHVNWKKVGRKIRWFLKEIFVPIAYWVCMILLAVILISGLKREPDVVSGTVGTTDMNGVGVVEIDDPPTIPLTTRYEFIFYTVSPAEVIEETESLSLPEDIPTNVKFFTDYRVYNIPGTPHNRLQKNCWTDSLGLRRYGKDYVVALGSYYSINIGDRFEVTLENGNIFTVILGDGKGKERIDTDPTHRYTPCVNYDGEAAANVLEFIIDEVTISDECFAYGSVDYLTEFKGNLVSMKYLGRAEGDWDTYL